MMTSLFISTLIVGWLEFYKIIRMPFRIAVIGCGSIAMDYHGPAYQKYAARHEDIVLEACCDLVYD
jgi:hypothetical protein